MADFYANFTLSENEPINANISLTETQPISATFSINMTPGKLSELQNDDNYVQDADYTHTDNNFTNNDKVLLNIITNTGDGTQYLSNDGNYKTIEYGVISVNGLTGDVVLSIPKKTSELDNDIGFITGFTETDPIYTADKPSIALKSDLPDMSGYATKIELQRVKSLSIAMAVAL